MDTSLSIELKRKGLHLLALIIPVGLFFFPERITLPLLFSVTAAFLVVEASRALFPVVQKQFLLHFSPLLRKHEETAWTGSTFLVLSASLCTLFFLLLAGTPTLRPDARLALYYAFSFLILGDAAAAVFGKTFGQRRLFGKKTLEGALACVAACATWYALSLLWLPDSIGPGLAFAAALLTAFLEILPLRLDDNFRVAPACCGLIYCMLRLEAGL
ncbi:MAG: phosphatidate cytidylyltransferase [Fibrobacterota bacterium]